MPFENIFYCSRQIVNDPPDEFLSHLPGREKAEISRRLTTIRQLPPGSWPSNWVEKIGKNLVQLKTKNYRLYFGFYDNDLVVFYICKKIGKKARPQDIDKAKLNQQRFEA